MAYTKKDIVLDGVLVVITLLIIMNVWVYYKDVNLDMCHKIVDYGYIPKYDGTKEGCVEYLKYIK